MAAEVYATLEAAGAALKVANVENAPLHDAPSAPVTFYVGCAPDRTVEAVSAWREANTHSFADAYREDERTGFKEAEAPGMAVRGLFALWGSTPPPSRWRSTRRRTG